MRNIDTAVLSSFTRQGEDLRALFRQLENRTQAHAVLITGEKGTGKRTLARIIASALLCSSEGQRPCGECRNCRLAENDEHPDVILIEKGNPIAPGVKKDRPTIPVEDIREMIRLCGIRSTEGNMRIILIFEAEKMTLQAQNCLLKTLEEPPSDTCMILTSDQPEGLLPTVISRCCTLRLKAWDNAYILSVLNSRGISGKRAGEAVTEANGSIGRALELADDEEYWKLRDEVIECFFRKNSRSEILKISNEWKDRKQDADRILSILESCVRRMSEARFCQEKSNGLSDLPAQWQHFASQADKERFVFLAEAVTEARKQLQFSTNFQAVLERLIFTYMGEGIAWQV